MANDLALGRRARSFGVRWLRTADLVVHAARTKPLTRGRAAQVIDAMESAGRMGSELAAEYRQEIVDG